MDILKSYNLRNFVFYQKLKNNFLIWFNKNKIIIHLKHQKMILSDALAYNFTKSHLKLLKFMKFRTSSKVKDDMLIYIVYNILKVNI